MRPNPLEYLSSIPKTRVMCEYKALESAKIPKEGPVRRPPIALRLALSVFGNSPREGFLPMRFFAEEDVQVYIGLPNHLLNKLLTFSGHTTSRKIVQTVFPNHQKKELLIEERYAPDENLPPELYAWIEPVSDIIKRIREEGKKPPPLNVLNFAGGKNAFWLIRAEHLCGQVPDGTHRVLAYAILGSEFPDMPVSIRVLHIHPLALAVVNCLTIILRFFMDPFRTPAFIKKRFGGSACFVPMEKPPESN
jgi:hypothetical protein